MSFGYRRLAFARRRRLAQADVAGELEREVTVVHPDFAAVAVGRTLLLGEVKRLVADVAECNTAAGER